MNGANVFVRNMGNTNAKHSNFLLKNLSTFSEMYLNKKLLKYCVLKHLWQPQ
jgi:hypothetical protein